MPIPSDYYTTLARIESNNQLYARAPSSTASGLYQFIRSTWESLGGTWGTQSGVAFGGLRPSREEQHRMVERLTAQNASVLQRAGVLLNKATLYAAHFLGAGAAARLLAASPNTPIESVTTAAQRRANPTILKAGSTVADFFAWLERKTGDAVNAIAGSGSRGATFPCPHCGEAIRADRAT